MKMPIIKKSVFILALSAIQLTHTSSVSLIGFSSFSSQIERRLSDTSKQLTLITSQLEALSKQQCKLADFNYGIQTVVGELRSLRSALTSHQPACSSSDTSNESSAEWISHMSKQLSTLDTSLHVLTSSQTSLLYLNEKLSKLNKSMEQLIEITSAEQKASKDRAQASLKACMITALSSSVTAGIMSKEEAAPIVLKLIRESLAIVDPAEPGPSKAPHPSYWAVLMEN